MVYVLVSFMFCYATVFWGVKRRKRIRKGKRKSKKTVFKKIKKKAKVKKKKDVTIMSRV